MTLAIIPFLQPPPMNGWALERVAQIPQFPAGSRNERRFLEPPNKVTPIQPEPENPLTQPRPTPTILPEPSPKPPSEGESSGETFSVGKIYTSGNSIFKKEINSLLQPLQGQTVTLGRLKETADAITKLYVEKGFLTSSASLVAESLRTGMVEIRVVEGSLERIQVEGTKHLLKSYIRSRVALGSGIPLNVSRLEDSLRLLRSNPLIKNLEATLKAGSEYGKSILVVRVTEANRLVASVGTDNYSPPSIGGVRLLIDAATLNLSGIGDSLALSYRPRLEAFTGTYRIEMIYRVPLNPMDGSLQLRTLYEPSKVIEAPFNDLGFSGQAQWYSLSFRQPVIRTPREELALNVGFTYQYGQTFTSQGPAPFGFGPNQQGVTSTSVISFGQDYTLRDERGAWAFNSQINVGTGLFNATNNPAPVPDGFFISWLAQAQRAQVINNDNLLILQADLQLTPNSLLPSQQFVIGGGDSVRGYQENVRAGDNGIRFSIEDRMILVRNKLESPVFTLAPFFDLGYVWNNPNNPNFQAPKRFIAGLGLGFIWQPIPNMNIRLDYAPPLVYLKDRGDNIQDHGLYFSVNYKL